MSYTAPHDWSAGELVTATNLDNLSTCITELQTETPQGTIAILNTLDHDGEAAPDSSGPTSGTTALNVNSITLAAPAASGRVFAMGHVYYTKTVSTDVFQARLFIDGNVVCRINEQNAGGHTADGITLVGSAAVDTSGNVPVVLQLVRVSGTGTATVGGDVNAGVHAWFIPTV